MKLRDYNKVSWYDTCQARLTINGTLRFFCYCKWHGAVSYALKSDCVFLLPAGSRLMNQDKFSSENSDSEFKNSTIRQVTEMEIVFFY